MIPVVLARAWEASVPHHGSNNNPIITLLRWASFKEIPPGFLSPSSVSFSPLSYFSFQPHSFLLLHFTLFFTGCGKVIFQVLVLFESVSGFSTLILKGC